MPFAPHLAGPHDPVSSDFVRRANSVRRTSTIDSARPEGFSGPILVDARGRDLLTGADGSTSTAACARLRARLEGGSGRIERIAVEPEERALARLVGDVVGPGFRARMAQLLSQQVATGGVLHLLLDDWPGATLVSGYAAQRAAADSGATQQRLPPNVLVRLEDVCAGWAADGSIMDVVRSQGAVPTPLGPPAPPLGGEDSMAWHDIAQLAPLSMRRSRRLDVWIVRAGCFGFDGHFRDTHVDGSGVETVVHEYTVCGTVDAATRRVISVDARARVLPWRECPASLRSAERIPGMRLTDLRERVRNEMAGTSSCTHLNDTLRAVADVATLSELLSL